MNLSSHRAVDSRFHAIDWALSVFNKCFDCINNQCSREVSTEPHEHLFHDRCPICCLSKLPFKMPIQRISTTAFQYQPIHPLSITIYLVAPLPPTFVHRRAAAAANILSARRRWDFCCVLSFMQFNFGSRIKRRLSKMLRIERNSSKIDRRAAADTMASAHSSTFYIEYISHGCLDFAIWTVTYSHIFAYISSIFLQIYLLLSRPKLHFDTADKAKKRNILLHVYSYW